MNFRQSVIIAELWRPESQDLENFWDFFAFFGKTIPCGKIFQILFRHNLSRHQ